MIDWIVYRSLVIAFKLVVIATVVALTLQGCEDVIEVNVPSSEPRLVIEGQIFTTSGSWFLLSRTTNYFSPTDVEDVSGALIIVVDDLGHADTLVEHQLVPGTYHSRTGFHAESGHTYRAIVKVDGIEYSASSIAPTPLFIDSLSAEYQPGGGFGTEEDEGYRIHVYFGDPPLSKDYARIKIGLMFGNYVDWYRDYYLYNGRFSDGNTVDWDYFFDVFLPGQRVAISLITMSKPQFDYFMTLAEVSAGRDGTSLDVTPANPNTNWNNGALGYFGAFTRHYSEIDIIDTEEQTH